MMITTIWISIPNRLWRSISLNYFVAKFAPVTLLWGFLRTTSSRLPSCLITPGLVYPQSSILGFFLYHMFILSNLVGTHSNHIPMPHTSKWLSQGSFLRSKSSHQFLNIWKIFKTYQVPIKTCFPFVSSVLEIHTITQILPKDALYIWSFSSSPWLFYFKLLHFYWALLSNEFSADRGLTHL